MIKKKTIISIILGGLFISPVFAQSVYNTTGAMKSSATIENTCLISADNINFGQVFSPLTSQGSQSQMRVQCSNRVPYTVDLAYGGVYGTGSGNSNSIALTYEWLFENQYTVYDNSGTDIGTITCGFGSSYLGKVSFNNATVAALYGYVSGIQTDTKGACITNNTRAGTYPKGWIGAYNAPGKQSMGGNTGYSYGVMNGSLKGDGLAYKITVPGDITKVWNLGVTSYNSTGTGSEQTINMNAQIFPGKSSSLYPAQDIYTDTVTAVISY